MCGWFEGGGGELPGEGRGGTRVGEREDREVPGLAEMNPTSFPELPTPSRTQRSYQKHVFTSPKLFQINS